MFLGLLLKSPLGYINLFFIHSQHHIPGCKIRLTQLFERIPLALLHFVLHPACLIPLVSADALTSLFPSGGHRSLV